MSTIQGYLDFGLIFKYEYYILCEYVSHEAQILDSLITSGPWLFLDDLLKWDYCAVLACFLFSPGETARESLSCRPVWTLIRCVGETEAWRLRAASQRWEAKQMVFIPKSFLLLN